MDRYKEKELKRYVIADLSLPTNYIRSKGNGNYCLIDNIVVATKFTNEKIAEEICEQCTRNTSIALVVIPIIITYEIVEEEF